MFALDMYHFAQRLLRDVVGHSAKPHQDCMQSRYKQSDGWEHSCLQKHNMFLMLLSVVFWPINSVRNRSLLVSRSECSRLQLLATGLR